MNYKQNYHQIILVLLLLTFMISMVAPTFGATVVLQNWDLVDSGKHLDWGGSTAYQSEFNSSVTTWNNYKSGVIRKDSVLNLKDVTISDYSAVDGKAGVTSSSGTLKFNKYYMVDFNTNVRKNVCTHELGHALGLDHNQQGDVMHSQVTSVCTLSANDKASYDAAYSNY
ncbi:M57 family metalloprotease [Methanolapillus ohkumae]|uniref:Peptidase M43 pregnancy-associated plasma-A domain-containing protein n=1 Tax=Methanolapillus ohkumae TaxID=3028298 RepID=A0AA96V9B0_9EURY|nr:hypothetical protein MsAm2_14510 [Methanosarcinaceae archaeon Am2]